MLRVRVIQNASLCVHIFKHSETCHCVCACEVAYTRSRVRAIVARSRLVTLTGAQAKLSASLLLCGSRCTSSRTELRRTPHCLVAFVAARPCSCVSGVWAPCLSCSVCRWPAVMSGASLATRIGAERLAALHRTRYVKRGRSSRTAVLRSLVAQTTERRECVQQSSSRKDEAPTKRTRRGLLILERRDTKQTRRGTPHFAEKTRHKTNEKENSSVWRDEVRWDNNGADPRTEHLSGTPPLPLPASPNEQTNTSATRVAPTKHW